MIMKIYTMSDCRAVDAFVWFEDVQCPGLVWFDNWDKFSFSLLLIDIRFVYSRALTWYPDYILSFLDASDLEHRQPLRQIPSASTHALPLSSLQPGR